MDIKEELKIVRLKKFYKDSKTFYDKLDKISQEEMDMTLVEFLQLHKYNAKAIISNISK